ncbi:MAG: hypothetical protein RIS94_347 [Pseudomonadota bacterium]
MAVTLLAAAAPASVTVAPSPTPASATVSTASTLATTTTTAGPVASTVNDGFVQTGAVASTDKAYAVRSFEGVPSMAIVGSRIWIVWMNDPNVPSTEGPGTYIALSYSDNGGKTWSREYYLVPAKATDRVLDPRLWLAPDGKLWVLYAQIGNNVGWDGQEGAWVTVIDNPLAAKPTFSAGTWLADGIPTRPFLYNNQWMLFVDYLWMSPRFPSRAGKMLFSMDYANRKLTQVGYAPRSTNADFDESTAVQLRDGSILLQNRTYNGIVQSLSTPAAPFVFSAPALWPAYPSVASRHMIVRSPSGRLAMVWDKGLLNGTRNDMTVAFSDDEGKTWPWSYTFDSRGDVSYPTIDYDKSGAIVVCYDYSRYGAKQILLAKLDEASIIAGTPKPPVFLIANDGR